MCPEANNLKGLCIQKQKYLIKKYNAVALNLSKTV